MILYLEDRGALAETSYARCLSMIRERLVELQPGGVFLDQHIEAGIGMLVSDPGLFLGKDHGIPEEELNEICMRGEQGLTKEDFDLLWTTLKDKANKGTLQYGASSLSQLKTLMGTSSQWSKVEQSKGKGKAVLQVTSDVDAMVLAVNRSGGGGGGGGDQRTWSPPCTTCNCFHGREWTGPCRFFDVEKKKVLLKGMLTQEGVLQHAKDKSWFVGKWFKDKLNDYGFDAMKITAPADRQKVFEDLNRICKEIGKCEANMLPAQLRPIRVHLLLNSKVAPTGTDADRLQASRQTGLLLEEKLSGHTPAERDRDASQSQKVGAVAKEDTTQEQEQADYEYDDESETWGPGPTGYGSEE